MSHHWLPAGGPDAVAWALYLSHSWTWVGGEPAAHCWTHCKRLRVFCPEFCCQPPDGGNPACWDADGHYSFKKCCADLPMVTDPGPEVLATTIGSLTFELYRGPSTHNSPKVNERTLEVALGLWFMRRSLSRLEGTYQLPLELGDVLGHYWPKEDRIDGVYLPWQLADLGSNGQDATAVSFEGSYVLSLSTVEHVGHDNEGIAHVNGFRTNYSRESLEQWVRAWDEAPSLLMRIATEAAEFLVTFPIGFNARLDEVVANSPQLRAVSRVLRRVDVQNLWEEDPTKSFDYHYELQDAYLPETTGLMHHPSLPDVYEQIYGRRMPAKLRPPFHPRFRFANAVCVVTNIPELLL